MFIKEQANLKLKCCLLPTHTHTHTRHTHKNTDNDFSTIYIISKVKNAACCIRELYILVLGLSLAETAACPPFFSSSPSWTDLHFLRHPVLPSPFSLPSGVLLVSSALSPTLASTDKQRSVSLHSQVYEAGLQIVALSCQEDFFLALWSLTYFLMGQKTVRLFLSSFHPFFLAPYPSFLTGLVDLIPTKH